MDLSKCTWIKKPKLYSFCDGIWRDQFVDFTGSSFLRGKKYSRGTGTILIESAELFLFQRPLEERLVKVSEAFI